jgi:hypothetical protein
MRSAREITGKSGSPRIAYLFGISTGKGTLKAVPPLIGILDQTIFAQSRVSDPRGGFRCLKPPSHPQLPDLGSPPSGDRSLFPG